MAATYPSASFHTTQPEGPRRRLSVAFRPILALPHLLLVGGPGMGLGVGANRTGVFGLVAVVGALINWFAIIFTGRAIQGLQHLQISYMHWRANAVAYEAMLRDEYPPFGEGDYPVTAQFAAQTEDRKRLSVAFRLFLVLPHAIVLALLFIAWFITAIIGWFAVLLTGTYPPSLWRFGEGVMRWSLRVEAYSLLLNDDFPPFSLE